MITLSFDTSLAACSAAVVDSGTQPCVLASSYCEPGKGHAEILLGMIGDVMSEAGVGFGDIAQQVVTIGPGSFTGVRVALSAARGFRIAHDIPICGLSTMQAIAANKSKLDAKYRPRPVAIIIDARRNQAYGQVFDAALEPLCAPGVINVDDIEGWLEPWETGPLILMGSGASLAGTSAGERLVMTEHASPVAACFAQIIKNLTPGETPPDPLYLRMPDAKPQVIGQAGL